MTTTTPTHTAASLAAIYDRNPRELDALAHFVVFGFGAVGIRDGEPVVVPHHNFDRYSASLDAAALLEKALSERGLGSRYGDELMWNIGICPCGDVMCIVGGHDAFKAISASAAQRTIAAVLAAQSQQEEM